MLAYGNVTAEPHTAESGRDEAKLLFFFFFLLHNSAAWWMDNGNERGMETPQMKKTRGGPSAAPRWCWRHETTRHCHGNCTWVGWGVLRRSRPRGIAAPGRLAWWTNRHVRGVSTHTQFTQVKTCNFSFCSAARPQRERDVCCKRAPWGEAKVNGTFWQPAYYTLLPCTRKKAVVPAVFTIWTVYNKQAKTSCFGLFCHSAGLAVSCSCCEENFIIT